MNGNGSLRASSRDTTKRFKGCTKTEGADTQPWDGFEGIQKWGQRIENNGGVIEDIS